MKLGIRNLLTNLDEVLLEDKIYEKDLDEWVKELLKSNKFTRRSARLLLEDPIDNLHNCAPAGEIDMAQDHTFSLVTSRMEEFDEFTFLKPRHLSGESTFQISGRGPIPAGLNWQEWLVSYVNRYTFVNEGSCLAYKEVSVKPEGVNGFTQSTVRLHFYVRHKHVNYSISGDKAAVEQCKEEIIKLGFIQQEVEINWVFGDSYREMEEYTLPLKVPTPIPGAYPWLGSTVKEFVQSYLESSASITIFIGPPGTGKTTLIKEILQELGSNAMVTYDSKLLFSDGFFASFMSSGTSDTLVIEDADEIMRPREEGNSLMHKLLNISDGLISLKHKKIIFTTNLPSVKEIDPALLRKGRCFATVNARKMTFDEATKFYAGIRPDNKLVEKRDYSLAELINDEELKVESFANPDKKVGFF